MFLFQIDLQIAWIGILKTIMSDALSRFFFI